MPKSKEFISSSDSDSGSDVDKPKKKKQKKEKPAAKAESPQKKTSSGEKGPNGEVMFQIANKRYVTVSEFRGKVMVGIREFYDKDGQMLPGKKGISLPLDQWKRLKEQIEEVDEAVKDLS